MNENYIAVDIGASSGRLMLAEKNFQDKITLREQIIGTLIIWWKKS